jgi:heme O synthase-like polyprenyltransferase
MFPLVGRGGHVYAAAMALAGAFLFYPVAKLARSTSKLLPRRVVFASVIYLPLILGIMIAWKRVLG